MKQTHRINRIFVTFALTLLLAFAVMPAAAQQNTVMPDTITVIGSGSANGQPDIATIEVAVETFNVNLAEAFAETNSRVQAVIDALVELGLDADDVRTVGFNIYQDRFGGGVPMMEMSQPGQMPEPTYVVSNQLRIIVRDTEIVAEVINTAVEAGANQIYGLNFGIDDRADLESEARADAVADARARAGELASLVGAELGDAIVITEVLDGGYYPRGMFAAEMSMGGGGGAVIQPGQLSVSVQVQVTFSITR